MAEQVAFELIDAFGGWHVGFATVPSGLDDMVWMKRATLGRSVRQRSIDAYGPFVVGFGP
jgi:hypothetical protein